MVTAPSSHSRSEAPTVGDPLYPTVSDAPEEPAEPLRLVARTLSFVDPVDGTDRRFDSAIALA